MPLVMDLISKENVHDFHKAFVDGVVSLPRTKAGDIGLIQSTFDAVGMPIVRYVYTRLMQEGQHNDTGKLGTYPYMSTMSVHTILSEEGVWHEGTKGRSIRLATDIARILVRSGIGHYVRAGHTWYLRPFDESKVEYHSSYEKKVMVVDARVEKRIEQEADQPVTSSFELRTFKAPEGVDSDEYTQFLVQFIPAALKIQDERDTAIALIAEMTAQADDSKWKSLGTQIEELLNS